VKPGTVVRYSPAYLAEERADPNARFTIAEPCPPKSSRKGKPSCWLCARGQVRLTDGRHIHPDNLVTAG
jgi:hypothetical protein